MFRFPDNNRPIIVRYSLRNRPMRGSTGDCTCVALLHWVQASLRVEPPVDFCLQTILQARRYGIVRQIRHVVYLIVCSVVFSEGI